MSFELSVISADAFAAGLRAVGPDVRLDSGDAAIVILVGGHEACRPPAASVIDRFARRHPGAVVRSAPRPDTWPFRRPLLPPLPSGPVVIWAPALEEAFVNRQTAATHLVTTQAGFLAESWTEAVGGRTDVLLVATAAPDAIAEHAPDILSRRGPFARAFVHEVPEAHDSGADGGEPVPGTGHLAARAESPATFDRRGIPAGGVAPPSNIPDILGRRALPAGRLAGLGATPDFQHGPPGSAAERLLARAMRAPDVSTRLALIVEALALGRHAPALVAAASTCMEANDLVTAERDLAEAVELEPGWAAVHFEQGKLRLRKDDMEGAAAAFRAAAELMPAFAPAWANLGATLGELGRPDDALAAFQQALAHDPTSPQAVNNVGVVSRELGRLSESEAAFRQVIALSPDMAFGYYNLGHVLFLQGRYHAALSSYAEGQRRDPDRNPVQASRLALCRLATGDAAGALRDLQQATAHLPRDFRQQLLGDTHAITWALLTHKPDLEGWHTVHEWLSRELQGT